MRFRPLTVDFSLRPLKLALVTRRYPPLVGGAEKVFHYLAGALAAEGAEVTVLTSQIQGLKPAGHEEVASEEVSRGTANGRRVARGCLSVVRLETSRVRFWGTWLYMRNLKHWFQDNPIDLAYVSMLKHDAYVVVGAGKRKGFRVVLRPEGAGDTGDLAWQSWGNFGRAIGLRCRDTDAFVAISSPIEHELREAWHSGTMRPSRLARFLHRTPKVPRIIAIPNGVPVPEKAWQLRPDWQRTPRAVFIGRLAPEKGLDTLIGAWPIVRASYPDARLTLIGEGPQRRLLEDQANILGLTPGPGQAVDLPGAVVDPSLNLRNADLFVLPSREEGMSVALLEAMALGIPLVASSIPGNRRLISDFEHGRLFPPDDADRLARVIIEQWKNLDCAIHMGREARNRVDQEFSIEAIARQHLALFRDIVENR
jgi:glycosyltransferase involved in cell wall biosynthesis